MPTVRLPADLIFAGSCAARASSFLTAEPLDAELLEAGVELSTQPVSASAAIAAKAATGATCRMRIVLFVLLPMLWAGEVR